MSIAIFLVLAFQAAPMNSLPPACIQGHQVKKLAPTGIHLALHEGNLDFARELQTVDTDGAAYEEWQLARRFNGLLEALGDFASSYNTGLIDVKKASAVRKALRELEKSPWFKPLK